MDPRRTLLDVSSPPHSRPSTKGADPGDTAASKNKNIFPGCSQGDRRIADLMEMAAKFAYENDALVKEVVTNTWEVGEMTLDLLTTAS